MRSLFLAFLALVGVSLLTTDASAARVVVARQRVVVRQRAAVVVRPARVRVVAPARAAVVVRRPAVRVRVAPAAVRIRVR